MDETVQKLLNNIDLKETQKKINDTVKFSKNAIVELNNLKKQARILTSRMPKTEKNRKFIETMDFLTEYIKSTVNDLDNNVRKEMEKINVDKKQPV